MLHSLTDARFLLASKRLRAAQPRKHAEEYENDDDEEEGDVFGFSPGWADLSKNLSGVSQYEGFRGGLQALVGPRLFLPD